MWERQHARGQSPDVTGTMGWRLAQRREHSAALAFCGPEKQGDKSGWGLAGSEEEGLRGALAVPQVTVGRCAFAGIVGKRKPHRGPLGSFGVVSGLAARSPACSAEEGASGAAWPAEPAGHVSREQGCSP